jgi:UDP:flavonoid glycosyltransferase YjiC (YdhE family)
VSDRRTVVFFPEGAFGPTNNCVGIGDVLRSRGHRVVFVVEESFAGTLEARGFEEATMRLQPPPGTYELEPAELTGAIDRLLADARLRARLAGIATGLRADPGTVRAAGLIERLASGR